MTNRTPARDRPGAAGITPLSKKGELVMAAKALVQIRIDADVKEQATAVLEDMGLTVSERFAFC
jgi:hypothetical protein